MKKLKIYLKSIAIFILSILITNIIITIFHYFDIFNINIIKVIKIITVVVSSIISGIYLGLNSNKKAYIEGSKLGLIIITFMILFSIIFDRFTFKSLIYFLIILISIIFGAIIGIQKKKD